MANMNGSSLIRVLFDLARPLAVFRTIVSIVVDPVQREPFGAWPHIAQECRKRVSPFLAHRNAASAIVRIADAFRLIASVFGSSPCGMLSRSAKIVFGESLSRVFGFMTSATGYQSAAK